MREKWYIRIWTSKKYIDFWSTNHTLSGCNLAAIFFFTKTSLLISIIVTLAILIAWEFFEFSHGVKEVIQNRISDVTVGMVGFFVTHYLMLSNVFNNTIFFVVIFLSDSFLGAWGFWAYKRAKK